MSKQTLQQPLISAAVNRYRLPPTQAQSSSTHHYQVQQQQQQHIYGDQYYDGIPPTASDRFNNKFQQPNDSDRFQDNSSMVSSVVKVMLPNSKANLQTKINKLNQSKMQTGVNLINLDLHISPLTPQNEQVFLRKRKMQLDTLPSIAKASPSVLVQQAQSKVKKIVSSNSINRRSPKNGGSYLNHDTSAIITPVDVDLTSTDEQQTQDSSSSSSVPKATTDPQARGQMVRQQYRLDQQPSNTSVDDQQLPFQRYESPQITSRTTSQSMHNYHPMPANASQGRVKQFKDHSTTIGVVSSVDHPYYLSIKKQSQQQLQKQQQLQVTDDNDSEVSQQQQGQRASSSDSNKSASNNQYQQQNHRSKYLLISKITSDARQGGSISHVKPEKSMGPDMNDTLENVDDTQQQEQQQQQQGAMKSSPMLPKVHPSTDRSTETSTTKGIRYKTTAATTGGASVGYNENLNYFGVKLQSCSLQRKKENIAPAYNPRQQMPNRSDSLEGVVGDIGYSQIIESRKISRKIIDATRQPPHSNLMQLEETPRKPRAPGSLKPRQPVSSTLAIAAPPVLSEEMQISQKIATFLDFQRVLNFSNRLVVQVPQTAGVKIYKAYITKGNNGVLIRAALKSRWWWSLSENADDMEGVHFLWTQWRKPQFYKLMKPRAEQASIAGSSADGYSEGNRYSEINWQMSQASLKQQKKQLQVQQQQYVLQQQQPKDINFSHIAQITNTRDFQLLKNYATTKVGKKQAKYLLTVEGQQCPQPVFQKESYEEEGGIETVYDAIRGNPSERAQPATTTVFRNALKSKTHNHMEFTFHLANKKALFYNMKAYYTAMKENVFDYLPVTFHVQSGVNDPEFTNFVDFYNNFEANHPKRKNVWIIKPGESSNRGNGIQVAGDVATVRDIIKSREDVPNNQRTFIIQQYIDRPFLYNKRKFDIRCFMLMTNYNDNLKVYWYQEGYIRTSTKEFTLKNLENRMIHLTNEAVQKKGDDFGKYENGNKLSYQEFQKYIDSTYPKDNLNFMQTVYPRMKKLAYDSVCSVFTKIDKKKRNFSFELFGLDFMIDESFQTWLIEINTNPSLTIAAPLMSRLLPGLIDNVIKIAIDPIFPPPTFPKSKKHLVIESLYENNKFDLLFDSDIDAPRLLELYANMSSKIDDQLEEDCKNEEVYEDDDADQENEEE